MRGSFRQDPAHPYVAARARLLSIGGTHAAPGVIPSADDPAAAHASLAERLAFRGAAAVRLARPFSNSELLAFGGLLGAAIVEQAPAVAPLVEEKVILNLVSGRELTSDPDLQPFAANWLTLHSESSAAPVARQPRYIVLMCVVGGPAAGAETVLVPMLRVSAALSPADRALLAQTRCAGRPGAPALLRYDGGVPVFSVRDFQDDVLDWEYTGGPVDRAEIDDAITRLYTAMYDSAAFGLRWVRGMLAVIDNQRCFHGRTESAVGDQGPARHLKRLRIAGTDAAP